MSVQNKQVANANTFNTAFVSRTTAQTVAGGKQFSDYVATTEAAVASSATITSLSSSASKVRLTGSTATELQGIAAGVSGQVLFLYNATNQTITVKHQNTGASAAARIITYSGANLLVPAGDTLLLNYDSTQSRWVQSSIPMSGAGSMTNPMTTGGDLIYGGASGIPTRLANGNANEILKSNGTTTAPSWVRVNCNVTVVNSSTSIPTGSDTVVLFSTEEGTASGLYSSGTGLVTIPSGGDGDYFVSAMCAFGSFAMTSGQTIRMGVFKNSGVVRYIDDGEHLTGTVQRAARGSTLLRGLVAGDTIGITMFQNSGSSRSLTGDALRQMFSIFKVGV